MSEAAASLDSSGRKARYGVAYLRAVCAQAGVLVKETSPDEDVLAVDCDVTFPEAPVCVQVKCTSTRTLGGVTATVSLENSWKAKWAKQLLPVYLLLVIVPTDVEQWLDHHDDGTLMRATAAYWVRVTGAEGTSVAVPKEQRLTAATLGQWHEQLLHEFGGGA